MWLKKMLSRPPPPPVSYPDKPNQNKPFDKENEEEEGPAQSPLIDTTPDNRYQNESIIEHTAKLKIPLIALHHTETIFLEETNFFTAKVSNSEEVWHQIDIMVSDRQIIITPNIIEEMGRSVVNYFPLSFGHIEKCEIVGSKNKKQQTKLHIVLKNNRQITFKSVLGDLVVKVYEIIKKFGLPPGINKFYAFKYGKLNKEKDYQFEGWKVFDIKKEFARQGIGIDEGGEKFLFKWIQNKNGEISPTYPELLVIPSKINMENLKKCAAFRTKERFPALTYALQYMPSKFSTLFRCSQNKVGVLNSRSKEDEEMISYIGDPFQGNTVQTCKPNCKIYDARGYYAALGNMLAGKGYQKEENYKNCEIEWLNIPNIHAVRDSHNQMFSQKDTNSNYFTRIAQSGWYDYLYLILSGAKSIAKDLMSGLNVVVHCSDGWDRTSQLCALSQILLDPFYRTIQGLMVIIEKDWRHFGHKFRDRTAQYKAVHYNTHEKSQIFIQFLDCIYQIMNQFPLSFQYNERLLLFLAENADSNVYGTFMTNNIQQAKLLKIEEETISIWSAVREHLQIFINPFYKSELQELWLDVGIEAKNMKVWRQYFFGDGVTQNTAYHMMRQANEINRTMRNQYYSNENLIKQLEEELKKLSEKP